MLAAFLLLLGFAMVGAWANRFRGDKGDAGGFWGTQKRRVVYAATMAALAMNPLVFAPTFALYLVGLGFPVDAATGAKKGFESEACLLDTVAMYLSHGAVSYGHVWLGLLGGMCGIATSLIVGSWFPLLWGFMGACYAIGGNRERGEYVFGALQGLTLALVAYNGIQ